MAFENLSDREKQILANLINHYIRSADPVGSRVIANKFKMGLSSATIRNTLQDLEELGLVEQPHTSAGRVPTDVGYRVYVDTLLKPDQLTDDEKEIIRQTILKEGRGIKEILGQTARLLSDVTSQLGVTIAPRFEEGILRDIRLIQVSDERMMVVVIVESGLARSLVLEVETSVRPADLQGVETVLNEKLRGLSLSDIRDTLSERLADVTASARLLKLVIDSKDRIWREDSSEDLLVYGKENLLAMPEFSKREQLLTMLRVLEDDRVLAEYFSHIQDEGLVITIGSESTVSNLLGVSTIAAPYKVGNVSGSVGIIGPTRMPYGKAVSIVEYTAR